MKESLNQKSIERIERSMRLVQCFLNREEVGTARSPDALSLPARSFYFRMKNLMKAALLRGQYQDMDIDLSSKLQTLFRAFESCLFERKSDYYSLYQQVLTKLFEIIGPYSNKDERRKVFDEIMQARAYVIAFVESYKTDDPSEWQKNKKMPDDASYSRFITVDEQLRHYTIDSINEKLKDWGLPVWETEFLYEAVIRLNSIDKRMRSADSSVSMHEKNSRHFFMHICNGVNNRPLANQLRVDRVQQPETTEAVSSYVLNINRGQSGREVSSSIRHVLDQIQQSRTDAAPDRIESMDVETDTIKIPVLIQNLTSAQVKKKGSFKNTDYSAFESYKLALRSGIRECVTDTDEFGQVEWVPIASTYALGTGDRRYNRFNNDRYRVAWTICTTSIRQILLRKDLSREIRTQLTEALNFFEKNHMSVFQQLSLLKAMLSKENIKSDTYQLFCSALVSYCDACRSGPNWRSKSSYPLYLASFESILMQEAKIPIIVTQSRVSSYATLQKVNTLFLRQEFLRLNGEFPTYGSLFETVEAKIAYNELFQKIADAQPGQVSVTHSSLHRPSLAQRISRSVKAVVNWGSVYKDLVPFHVNRLRDNSRTTGQRIGSLMMIALSSALPFLCGPIATFVSSSDIFPSYLRKEDLKKKNDHNDHDVPKKRSKSQPEDASLSSKFVNECVQEDAAYMNASDPITMAVFNQMNNKSTHSRTDDFHGSSFYHAAHLAQEIKHLYSSIMRRKVNKSQSRGIGCHYLRSVNGRQVLVRDARQYRTVPPRSEYDLVQIALSYLLAGVTLVDMEYTKLSTKQKKDTILALEKFRKGVVKCEKKMIETIMSIDRDTSLNQEESLTSLVQDDLIPFVEKTLNDLSGERAHRHDLHSDLTCVKNWVALYEPTSAMVTIDRQVANSGAQIDIMRVEEPLTELTAELRDEFNRRKSRPWYLQQPLFIRDLIDYFTPYILKGHQIPSQLRRYIPGLKNAYRTTISAVLYDENGEAHPPVKLSSNSHCASVVPVIFASDTTNPDDSLEMKSERERLTAITLRQQKFLSGCSNHTMVALNSEVGDFFVGIDSALKGKKVDAFDREMAQVTMKASTAPGCEGIESAKICLNKFNLVEGNKVEAIHLFVAKMDRFINEVEESRLPLKLMPLLKGSLTRLRSHLKTSPVSRIVRHLDQESIGVQIIQEYTLLADVYNHILQMIPPSHKLRYFYQTQSIFYACASGENRTGIVEYSSQIAAITYHLEMLTGEKITRSHIAQKMAETDHITYITGSQGSSFGTGGIRKKSCGSLPNEFHRFMELLIRTNSDIKEVNRTKSHAISNLYIELNTCMVNLQNQIKGSSDSICSPLLEKMVEVQKNLSMHVKYQGDKSKKANLIRSISELFYMCLRYTIESSFDMPIAIRDALRLLGDIFSMPALRTVSDINEDDIKIMREKYIQRRKNVCCSALGAVSVGVFFPIVGLAAAKVAALKALAHISGLSLKWKLGVDTVTAAAAGSGGKASLKNASNQPLMSCRQVKGLLFSDQRKRWLQVTLGHLQRFFSVVQTPSPKLEEVAVVPNCCGITPSSEERAAPPDVTEKLHCVTAYVQLQFTKRTSLFKPATCAPIQLYFRSGKLCALRLPNGHRGVSEADLIQLMCVFGYTEDSLSIHLSTDVSVREPEPNSLGRIEMVLLDS